MSGERKKRTIRIYSRRGFLERSAQVGLGAAALAMGCSPAPEDPARADMRSDPDMRGADMAPDAATADMAIEDLDAGTLADARDAADQLDLLAFSKYPFVQYVTQTQARLRFETWSAEPVAVRLERVDGVGSVEEQTTPELFELEWSWPGFRFNTPVVDEAGTYYTQTVQLDGLVDGARYRWLVDRGQGVEYEGGFRWNLPPEESARMLWIADTMYPISEEILANAAKHEPDYILHGGDVQYFSNPGDTWNGFFHFSRDLFKRAPFGVMPGNHEYEDNAGDEFRDQYSRLFDGQGDGSDGTAVDYWALTLGPVRILALNSESDLHLPESAQHKWMLAQLEAADKDARIKTTIVAFHRPLISFTRIPNRARRELLHPIFMEHNVSLVLTGHDHNYQRYVIDDIVYIVDGGGGAFTYAPDDELWKVERDHPEEIAWRKAAANDYGYSLLDFAPDGTITYTKHGRKDDVLEMITIG